MYEFAASRMPNGVQRIDSAKAFAKFAAMADKYALPKLLLVTREGRTTVEAKSLSTEIRRRALVGLIRASKPNKDIISKLRLDDWLKDKSGPKTVVVALKGEGTDGGVVCETCVLESIVTFICFGGGFSKNPCITDDFIFCGIAIQSILDHW